MRKKSKQNGMEERKKAKARRSRGKGQLVGANGKEEWVKDEHLSQLAKMCGQWTFKLRARCPSAPVRTRHPKVQNRKKSSNQEQFT